ncbi:alkaline phosphatase-like isoform X1 [Ostrea edulis]|uniref:alkaline phosphatase-like isoform X1 n=1 Tax=Ostrea edulis TaxID=37623 RepID=UPI0024AF0099|nr:alkaline phosphatase-like isoform X1 [Ostrea edulis]
MIVIRLCFLSAFVHVGFSQNEDSTHWLRVAEEELQSALKQTVNTNKAKNVILFVGDGMGLTTVTAARIYKGQQGGQPGEEGILEFEKFPHVGLSKTYLPNRQVADSAATATAMLVGEKTNWYTLGVTGKAQFGDCNFPKEAEIDTILQQSKMEGKSTGIVTTSRITHATPAAAYAKIPHRNWESDADLTKYNVSGRCRDIAQQLIYNNSEIDVLFGGGRRSFLPKTTKDTEKNSNNLRQDGKNLIREWKVIMEDIGQRYKYVENTEEFQSIDPSATDKVLGLFESSHMQYEHMRDKGPKGEPSLSEMTRKAIQILQKNKKGFFLLVEGARIDHAHHDNIAKRALTETIAMDKAVKVAAEMTKEEDTLIIVTADHSHVFNIAGYPKRGNDILGVVDPISKDWYPTDNMPFTTLLYANGPGGIMPNTTRHDPRNVNTTADDYTQTSAVPFKSETHGGEDVPIYARGPWSHLIHGVHEQHYVYHVMSLASCVGTQKTKCSKLINAGQTYNTNGVTTLTLVAVLYSLL